MPEQQQPNKNQNQNPMPKPNDQIDKNQPIEFPEMPGDDKKGQVLQPQGDTEKGVPADQKEYKNTEPGDIIQ